MADIVTPSKRSRMMSGIRGKNTKLEISLRRGLHARGLRFRLHDSELPGEPDLVFPKYHAVLFANGCFWHGHNCHLFKMPKTRTAFWREKIEGNARRDIATNNALRKQGWRVGTVWECAIKGRTKLGAEKTLDLCEEWLKGQGETLEIRGRE